MEGLGSELETLCEVLWCAMNVFTGLNLLVFCH